MPFEGFKGGGYDRSSLIRPAYHRRQLSLSSTSEQFPPLPALHPSLQYAFSPSRRYESPVTDANGRTFASSRDSVAYKDFPQSLMYSTFRTQKLKTPELPIGMTSSQVIGSSYLVEGKPPADSWPPLTMRSFK